jgi:hypothetical protein
MKQTAVEWLIEQINKHWDNKNVNSDELINQAKEMEKQQIFDAYITSHISMMSAEQYYYETFKQQEQ